MAHPKEANDKEIVAFKFSIRQIDIIEEALDMLEMDHADGHPEAAEISRIKRKIRRALYKQQTPR